MTIPNTCSMMATMNRGLAGFCRVQCGPAGRCGDGEEVGVLCLIILAVVSIVTVYTLYREG